VLGTASLRRRAALLALRPDLDVRELRGNVDTRLRRLADGDFDAIVLAQAGLDRLERGSEGTPLDPSACVPAPGQGSLVLEGRTDDSAVFEAVRPLTDLDALACLAAERAVVGGLEATCHTPIGAHAVLNHDRLRLTVFVGLPDGSHWIRDELDGPADDPANVGGRAADRMRAAGAAELLEEAERAVTAG
jgi:hydroxymethylbilane synthase